MSTAGAISLQARAQVGVPFGIEKKTFLLPCCTRLTGEVGPLLLAQKSLAKFMELLPGFILKRAFFKLLYPII